MKFKTSIFIGKSTFDKNFVELNNQLKSIKIIHDERLKPNEYDLESDKIELECLKIHENEVFNNWTERDVDNWILEKEIHPSIGNALRPSDGKILYEFFLMKKDAPSFFHESFLAENSTFTLRDYAIFSREINALFKRQSKTLNDKS